VRAVSFAHDCVHIALASLDGEWSVVRTDVRFDLKQEAKEHNPNPLTLTLPLPLTPTLTPTLTLKQEAKEHARGRAPNGTPFEAVALSPFLP